MSDSVEDFRLGDTPFGGASPSRGEWILSWWYTATRYHWLSRRRREIRHRVALESSSSRSQSVIEVTVTDPRADVRAPGL